MIRKAFLWGTFAGSIIEFVLCLIWAKMGGTPWVETLCSITYAAIFTYTNKEQVLMWDEEEQP